MSNQHNEAGKAYRHRGDYAVVTTDHRVVTIRLSHAEFAELDAMAKASDITRGAMARNILVEHLQDEP